MGRCAEGDRPKPLAGLGPWPPGCSRPTRTGRSPTRRSCAVSQPVARATADAAASVAFSIGKIPESTSPSGRRSVQVPIPITGIPERRARAISDKVPYSPSSAITAVAALTTSAFLASPRPVGTTTSTHGLATVGSRPGNRPTVIPPTDLAPRQTPSITPPRPPQITTAPLAARAAPTSSASRMTEGEASPAPMTAICVRMIGQRRTTSHQPGSPSSALCQSPKDSVASGSTSRWWR